MNALAQRSLELAEQSIGLSEPNPRVGCVIVTPTGQQVEGHTQLDGSAHAEAHAISVALQQGIDLRGGTAWVTLEPCSHFGRTPPCADALVRAGLRTVHVALADPYPEVAGQGLERLRNAGLEVVLHDDAWTAAARALNIGFLSRVIRGRPWVRMKMATSLDGTSALHNGQSQWITGAAARTDGHAWRKRAGAVLTGIGTVRDDNPRLDVRHVGTTIQPLRVLIDSRLEVSTDARMLQGPGRCVVYTALPWGPAHERLQALPGVEVCVVPTTTAPGAVGTVGKTDLGWVLRDLASRRVNELHLEAGERLLGSFLREGWVDELLLYQAPVLLGAGRGLARWSTTPLESLDQALRLHPLEWTMLDADLRLRALTETGQAFWSS